MIWLSRVFIAFIAAFFLVASAGRVIPINADGMWDEDLFINQALQIVAGNWLGPYNVNTFTKGPGYPIFLALNHFTGLHIGLGLALIYLGCTLYFSLTVARLCSSRLLFPVMTAALLFIPVMAEDSMLRLLREPLYCSITLAYFAALLESLFSGHSNRKAVALATLAGILGGFLWITREEGPWLLPPTFAAFVIAIARAGWSKSVTRALATLGAAGVVVCSIGALNYFWYDRFVVNETTAAPFRQALSALQRASVSPKRVNFPLPREEREKVYEQSPTFKKLQPYLDGEQSNPIWRNAGCEVKKEWCGDIAASWLWFALMDAANHVGAYRDPNTAANFYSSLATEINAACAEKRLVCAPSRLAFLPFADIDQLSERTPHFMWSALQLVLLKDPVPLTPNLPSHLSKASKQRVLDLLNRPPHQEVGIMQTHDRLTAVEDKIVKAWTAAVSAAEPAYFPLMTSGIAFAAILFGLSAYYRDFPMSIIVVTVLGLAVCSRIALLGLLSATSGDVIYLRYLSPAILLMVGGALASLFGLIHAGGLGRQSKEPSRTR